MLGQLLLDEFRVCAFISILLMATGIGTRAARAWLIASTVCGMTPSSAATTKTISVASLALMAVKASWPGVYKGDSLIMDVDLMAPMCSVMPRLPGYYIGFTYGIKQGCLSVINMVLPLLLAARLHLAFIVRTSSNISSSGLFSFSPGHKLQGPILRHQVNAVVQRAFILSCINFFITSPDFCQFRCQFPHGNPVLDRDHFGCFFLLLLVLPGFSLVCSDQVCLPWVLQMS